MTPEPATPASGAAGAFPRLRFLDAALMAEALDLGADIVVESGEPADWSVLLGVLQHDPARQSVLIRVLTWGLATTELLWWACLSARLEEIVSGRRARSRALILAERWLREKDDAVRYDAYRHAREETKATAGTLVGLATFVAGPSLAPQGAAVEAPPAGLAQSAAGSALVVAATSSAFEPMGYGFELVNMIGVEIAAGGDGRNAARRALAASTPPAAA